MIWKVIFIVLKLYSHQYLDLSQAGRCNWSVRVRQLIIRPKINVKTNFSQFWEMADWDVPRDRGQDTDFILEGGRNVHGGNC